jgi:hypothetical protein
MDRVNDSFCSRGCRLLVIGAALLLGAAAPVMLEAVELYRCTHNGRIEFRQTPCPTGEQEKTEVVEQSSGMTPIEPSMRLEKPPAKRSRRTAPPDRVSRQATTEKCWKTEKKLEKVQQQLRGGYKASRYRELHRKQNEYEDYLRLFCRS